MEKEKELVALLFEIASVGVNNRKFLNAIKVFDRLMDAAPNMELPLVGVGYMLILRGQYKQCLELFQSKDRLIKEKTVLYDATMAHALFLLGRVGEAERLLERVLVNKKDSDAGVPFAKEVLEECRKSYSSNGAYTQIMGRSRTTFTS